MCAEHSTTNPLATKAKREKKGSETYAKYRYQYHWALCRLLEEHVDSHEYVIFVEEHTDVVIADSLDPASATFQFSQVKETGKPLTVNALLLKKRGSSILQKLVEDATGKSFGAKISRAQIVTSGGFKFDLHTKGFNFEIIETSQLSDAELKAIREHLLNQLGSDSFVAKIAFVVSDLPPTDCENTVRGRISALVELQHPGSHCSAGSIYTCLIEDLQRKGVNQFDYADWTAAVKKKGITREQVQRIVAQNISRRSDSALQNQLEQMLTELKVSSIGRAPIRRAFQRYYEERVGSRSLALAQISSEICHAISSNIAHCKDAGDLLERVTAALSDPCKRHFAGEAELTAAVLYEYVSNA